ncbi:MAG: DUF937 domain-containing protein [Tepidisphaeraceae bacterium]
MNLVDLTKGQLGGPMLSKVAGMLGVSNDDARRATDVAVPSLLAMLSGLASTPDGARKLDAAVSQADEDMETAVAGARESAATGAEGAGGMLGSLFGGGALNGVASAISKFTGLAPGTITKLLGTLGPMVLGVLKGQKKSMGLDAGGMANLLASQKQNIAAAMPAGLGSMLSGVPGLGGLTSMFGDAGARASDMARDAGGHVRETAGAAYDAGRAGVADASRAVTAGASSAARWVIPVLVLLLLGAVAWALIERYTDRKLAAIDQPALPRPAAPVVDGPETPARDTTEGATAAAARIGDAATDSVQGMTTRVNDIFKSVTDSFTTITDPASAQAAVPKLRDATDKLGGLQTSMSALPADARNQVAGSIKTWADKLNPLIDKAMAIPGVGDRIGPVVKDMRSKLSALTGT